MKKNIIGMDAIETMELVRNLAAIGGALTGLAVVGSVIYDGVFGLTQNTVFAYIVVFVLCIFAILIIDFSYRKNIQYSFDLIITGKGFKNWKTGLFTILLFVLAAGQGFTSLLLSYEGRKDMVEALQKQPDLVDELSIKSALEQQTDGKLSKLRDELSKLQAKRDKAEKAVYDNNKKLVALVNQGNTWASNKLSKLVERATDNLDRQIDNKNTLIDNTLSQDNRMIQQMTMTTITRNNTNLSHFHEIKERNMIFVGYFGAGCVVIVFVISLLLSLANGLDPYEPEYENPDYLRPRKTAKKASQTVKEDPPHATEWQPELVRYKQAEDELSNIKKELFETKLRLSEMESTTSTAIADKPSTTTDNSLEPLSDKSDSVSTSSTVFVGDVVHVDVKKLVDKTGKQYVRQFTSATDKARQANADKYQEGRKQLEAMGFVFDEQPDVPKVSITQEST